MGFCRWLGLIAALLLGAGPGMATAGSAHAPLVEIASITVGARPKQVVVDPIRGRVYVVNSGARSLSVLDAHTLDVTTEWFLDGDIQAIATDRSTGTLYLAYDVSGDTAESWNRATELWAFDPETGSFPRGMWFGWIANGLAVDPGSHRVFMAGNRRSSGNGANSFPRLVALDGELTSVIVSIQELGLGSFRALDFDDTTGSLYVGHATRYCGADCSINVYGPNTLQVIGQAKTGIQASAVAADGHGHPIISVPGSIIIGDVGAPGRSSVPSMAIPVPSVQTTPPVRAALREGAPLAVDPSTGMAYLAPPDSPLVTISLGERVPRTGPQLPLGRHQLAVDSSSHRIYVTNEDAGTVTILQEEVAESAVLPLVAESVTSQD